jgi:hypothetical protein
MIDLLQCAHAHALLLHLVFDNLGRFLKVMSRYGPIGEIAAINTTEVENLDMVFNPLGMF